MERGRIRHTAIPAKQTEDINQKGFAPSTKETSTWVVQLEPWVALSYWQYPSLASLPGDETQLSRLPS